MIKTTTATLLAATAALLAVPAAGQAATIGSDLERAPGNEHTVFCGTDQAPQACTMIADRQPWEVDAPDREIITRWSAQLAAGTQARLRLLRRNADGTFTGAGESDAVTAPAFGVHTFRTHIPVPEGAYTVGIDILAGGVGAIADGGHRLGYTVPPLGATATARPDLAAYELFLNATSEEDLDADGRGDVTEDDCLFECPSSGGSGGDSGAGAGGGADGGAAAGGSSARAETFVPTPRQEEKPEPKGPPFVIDPRGLLRPDAEGRGGVFEVYAENEGSGDLDATVAVRAGTKVVGTQKISDLESGDETTVKFRLTAKQRKQLVRKGKLGLQLTATATHDDGTRTPVRQTLTVLRGGAAKYDGTYKGPGPIVFVVQGGAVRTVSSQVNAFCPRTNRHEQLSIFTIDGFPALVKPDGTFALEGNGGGQAMKYHGKLSIRGESKGYASAYRFQLGVGDGGRYFTDGCTGAINWTARKTK